VLDAQTDGKRFWCDCDPSCPKQSEGIPCAMACGQKKSIGRKTFVSHSYSPHLSPVRLDILKARAEAEFPSTVLDHPSDPCDYTPESIGPDVGFVIEENLRWRSGGHQEIENPSHQGMAAPMCEFAVRKGSGTTFAEKNVGLRV